MPVAEVAKKADRYCMAISSKIILCIDDDADDRELICEAISIVDPTAELIHADTGLKALDILKDFEKSELIPSDYTRRQYAGNGWQGNIDRDKEAR